MDEETEDAEEEDSGPVLRYEFLDGRIYSKESFDYWLNPKPLLVQIKPDWEFLPLDRFPLVEDFEVVIWRAVFARSRQNLGGALHIMSNPRELYLSFFSPSFGRIGRPYCTDWVEPEELCGDRVRIPGIKPGRIMDVDMGWGSLIVEIEDFVYVLESRTPYAPRQIYQTWYKVERTRYLSQWRQTIQLFCSRWNEQHEKKTDASC